MFRFRSWLHRLAARLGYRFVRRVRRARHIHEVRLSFQPRIETLETRIVPTLIPGTASVTTTEGALFDGGQVATFSDSNAADSEIGFSATIHWGDNTSSSGTVAGSNGEFTVS